MPEESLIKRWADPLRLLALLIGILLEIGFCWQIWWLGQEMTFLWGLVALVGGLGTAAGLTIIGTGNPWLLFWLFLGLTLFIPFYGALGSTAISFYLWRATGGKLADQYASYIDAEDSRIADEGESTAAGTVDHMVRQELNIQSYMDIMRGPDRLLKKALIGKILSEWTPNAVSLLKQGLKDEEYEIRSYSSTALTTIENRMNGRILQLKDGIAENPEDHSLQFKLAQSYLAYASSGLLDPGSASHYVRMGSDILETLPLPPPDEEDQSLQMLSLHGQAARLSDDLETEERIYSQILEQHPQHQETLSHLCALLFRQKRFGELHRTCDLFLQHTVGDHPAQEAAHLWSSSANETGNEVSA